ncbi:hypothetical protein ACIBBG_33980 [Micromonospora chersina]|uniref:hypothetical protein n=1 Tax=Micromonospora chersina TaxID=47854 RepID=UPI0037B48A31
MATWKQQRATYGWRRTAVEYLRRQPRIWRRRAVNRWYDLRAVLAGYCNNQPYPAIPGEGGGYAHWRCALKRGHEGMHRPRNYVWNAGGHTDNLPIPHGQPGVDQPWERSMTMTRRQDRQRDRWMNRRYAEMRASRD